MTEPQLQSSRRQRPSRPLMIALLMGIVIILGGAVAIGLFVRGNFPDHPDVLNVSTQAREARPLTTSPDPRFDPLPLEREKH
jgi:hypothetical protein